MVSPLQASPLQIWTSLGPLRVLLSQAWSPTPPHPVREPRCLFLAPRYPALFTFSLSL